MPSPVEALPCGSRSTTSTRWPPAASAVPRLIAVVVLPTPPFWLASARMRAREGGGPGLAASFTLNPRQPEDRPGGIGSAGQSLDRHPPTFARAGQFLGRPKALVEQADGAGLAEPLGGLEQLRQLGHRAGGDEVGGEGRNLLEAAVDD